MSEERKTQGCSGSCESCGLDCDSRQSQAAERAGNVNSHVKSVIGVVSGKGGVGKSFVTGALACALRELGASVGILDADITGPSIPKAFGIDVKARGDAYGMFPAPTKNGIEIMSMNMLLDDETSPVVWRGPIIASAVKQFWTDVQWGEKDFLLVDMPPGTGDVPLTVYQSLPVDGIIIVSTPQELVSMIVEKAVKMAETMQIPILGLIENMSYAVCPDCGKKISVFGQSHIGEIAQKYHLPVLAQLPIEQNAAREIDRGNMEEIDHSALHPAAEFLKRTQHV